MYRTDENNNPTAITVDVARDAGLLEGVDYVGGTRFPAPSLEVTAKLLGDPVAITVKVIDRIGYYTGHGAERWVYIGIPDFVWHALTADQKRDVIGFHYLHEGGVEMKHLFPRLI